MDWVIPCDIPHRAVEDALADLNEATEQGDNDIQLLSSLCALALDVLTAIVHRYGREQVSKQLSAVLADLSRELPQLPEGEPSDSLLARSADRAAEPSELVLTAANVVPAVLRTREGLSARGVATLQSPWKPDGYAMAAAAVATASATARLQAVSLELAVLPLAAWSPEQESPGSRSESRGDTPPRPPSANSGTPPPGRAAMSVSPPHGMAGRLMMAGTGAAATRVPPTSATAATAGRAASVLATAPRHALAPPPPEAAARSSPPSSGRPQAGFGAPGRTLFSSTGASGAGRADGGGGGGGDGAREAEWAGGDDGRGWGGADTAWRPGGSGEGSTLAEEEGAMPRTSRGRLRRARAGTRDAQREEAAQRRRRMLAYGNSRVRAGAGRARSAGHGEGAEASAGHAADVDTGGVTTTAALGRRRIEAPRRGRGAGRPKGSDAVPDGSLMGRLGEGVPRRGRSSARGASATPDPASLVGDAAGVGYYA